MIKLAPCVVRRDIVAWHQHLTEESDEVDRRRVLLRGMPSSCGAIGHRFEVKPLGGALRQLRSV